MFGEGFLPWWANILLGLFIGLYIGNAKFRAGVIKLSKSSLKPRNANPAHNLARSPKKKKSARKRVANKRLSDF